MSSKVLIGIDIGTQGTKAALFSEEGQCVSSSFMKSKLCQPSPGIVEEDPEQQLKSVCQTIKECIRNAKINPRSVAGIAIDGQMAGIIGVGKDGMNVTPYDSWLDTRCARYISKMEEQAGREILRKTGCSPSFNHGPKILWWMHERSKVFKSMESFVIPGAYVAMRLCGLDGNNAFFDKSYLHFSGFADNRNARWDNELCERFHLDIGKLPKIVNSHDVVGEILPSMAKKCGLKSWVPVVAGCGDTIASFLSCGATQEGIFVDVAGTASVFAATTREFRPDLRNRTLACAHSATPNLWHPYAYINGGGMNLEWFVGQIANSGSQRRGNAVSLDQLNRMAATVCPEEDAPLFVPHMGGRVCPSQPYLRGAWAGLNWNHSLAHLYRAMLEGVALEYGIYKRMLHSLFKDFKPREIRIIGGGEKSTVWNKLKADVLGIPVVQIVRSEGAPLGSALLAGFGVGLFHDLTKVAKQWIAIGNINRPDRKMLSYYERRLGRYEALIEKLNLFGQK